MMAFGDIRPNVGVMLESASGNLDRIFGRGAYKIVTQDAQSALLSTDLGNFEFTDDPRDFVACALLGFSSHGGQDPLDTYLRFLDIDHEGPSRADDWQTQLQKELGGLEVVVERVLKNSESRRDAAMFAKGYNRAYNDWASRKGSWAEFESES